MGQANAPDVVPRAASRGVNPGIAAFTGEVSRCPPEQLKIVTAIRSGQTGLRPTRQLNLGRPRREAKSNRTGLVSAAAGATLTALRDLMGTVGKPAAALRAGIAYALAEARDMMLLGSYNLPRSPILCITLAYAGCCFYSNRPVCLICYPGVPTDGPCQGTVRLFLGGRFPSANNSVVP